MLTATPLTAADLMTIDPIVISMEAPIEDAEDLIRQYHVSGLPVVDVDRDLVGIISQTDFIHLADPSVRALVHGKKSGIRVGEVMSRPAVTARLTTSLVDAARLMVAERVHRLVVVDEQHRPIGVLSAMDFVGLYAEG